MLAKIFITSFIVMAIYASMAEGMIFGKIRIWLSSLNDFYKKPLYDCPICMTFWYGSAIYWLIWHKSWHEWLITVIAAMGVNAIFYLLSVKEL